MFIISCPISCVICFTHWERDKHLRGSGFGKFHENLSLSMGEIFKGRSCWRKGWILTSALFVLWPPVSPGTDRGWQTLHLQFGTSKAYATHCSWWLSSGRDSWGLSAGFGGKVLETSQGIMVGKREHKSVKGDCTALLLEEQLTKLECKSIRH